MQTLNLHDVESVKISPMQEHNSSCWVTITITHDGGEFNINLFPRENNIEVTLPPTFTLSKALPNE
ncbi:MAG: hypothetical protein IPP10_15610 [Candidatus Competibacteraceae bacterium]|nr:hypothetical protein [Candidatus Competibacteraceae bacterium]